MLGISVSKGLAGLNAKWKGLLYIHTKQLQTYVKCRARRMGIVQQEFLPILTEGSLPM